MPQESNWDSVFFSPSKNLRGLKGLICNNNNNEADEIINDHELAQRKADEAGTATLNLTTSKKFYNARTLD